MTQELLEYIYRNYFHLRNEEEMILCNKHSNYMKWDFLVKKAGIEVMKDKLEDYELTAGELDFLANLDRPKLNQEIATRIWNTHKDELYINKCPTCGGIARTKEGRQCRKGHRW